MSKEAYQGHPYLHNGEKVISMESGKGYVKVLFFDASRPWEGFTANVLATKLKPLPLRYLHDQLPK